MKLGYIRTSTIDQNLDFQQALMERYQVDKVFAEKVSAKDTNRPKLAELLEFAREGDSIVIYDFSRLARNTRDLLDIVESLTRKGVALISSKENLDTSTPTGKLLLTVIGAIAEFERTNLLERQRLGIIEAKKKGVYKGRKPVEVENFGEWYEKWRHRELTKTQMAAELGISRQTLYNLFNEYERNLDLTTSNATA